MGQTFPLSQGWALSGLPAAHQSLPGSVTRALAYLDSRIDQPFDLESLSAAAGVRPRTLEAHFKTYLGTTPLGWLRRTRLARARQQLLAHGEDASVTDIAMANGFNQLGRFAGEYRRQFGELPSQTLRGERIHSDDSEVGDEAVRLSWRAISAAFTVGPKSCNAALADAERAQELTPDFALPKAIAAWCWGQRAAHGFSDTPQLDREKSLRLAADASRLGPRDSLALCVCSGALVLARRMDEADRMIERALAIEPWSPWGWVRRGWSSAYAGDDAAALRELRLTLQLMPFEPVRHLCFIGIGAAHFNAGQYGRAAQWIKAAVDGSPESFWSERILVAAAVHAGANSEARRYARRLMQKNPNLTVNDARHAWPFVPSFMNRLGDGLEKAGIPRS
jgi:AraC-like DNA-binding protein